MTRREHIERSGKSVPDYMPEPVNRYLVGEFWRLKSYAGDAESPLRYEYFSGALLDRGERDIILAMDAAFRSELNRVRQENDKIRAGKRK